MVQLRLKERTRTGESHFLCFIFIPIQMWKSSNEYRRRKFNLFRRTECGWCLLMCLNNNLVNVRPFILVSPPLSVVALGLTDRQRAPEKLFSKNSQQVRIRVKQSWFLTSIQSCKLLPNWGEPKSRHAVRWKISAALSCTSVCWLLIFFMCFCVVLFYPIMAVNLQADASRLKSN